MSEAPAAYDYQAQQYSGEGANFDQGFDPQGDNHYNDPNLQYLEGDINTALGII